MKRKALITATAVLLVAVMCLATASYAWFTGGGTVGIEQFEFSVGGTDADLLLAAADMTDKYSAETWSNTLSLDDWSSNKGIVPAEATNGNSQLTAVSTDDGKNFFATEYESGVWTSRAITSTDSYLLLNFWVKPEQAGTATMKVTLTDCDEKFTQSVKFGYAVTEGEIGSVENISNFTTYAFSADSTDDYQAVTATDAKCVKNTDLLFVPQDGSSGFGAVKEQVNIPESFTIDFDDDAAQLVTVAVWLEGMDKNCTGTWTLENQKVYISFDWTDAATNA